MKKLYFLPFLFLAITAFAQKQFVVQNGTAQTFDDLNGAIAAASAGDTLYLPGGGFSISEIVDKPLHWRGVGHYPDSTSATGFTFITGNAYFSGNCDNSTFEGIYFQSSLAFGSNDNECTGVSIKRCHIGGTLYFRSITDVSGGNPDLSCQLSECVTAALDARNGMNIRVEKNLIFSTISNFYQSYFKNNSINRRDPSYGRLLYYSYNCQFVGNVFAVSYGLYNSGNCNFENNIFAGNLPYNPTTSTFTGSQNITNIAGNIYSTIVGNIYDFSYENDYHLNNTATGSDEDGTTGVSIIGTAPDGNDAGIYGTSFPYKEGAVPYQPHIRTANIDNEAVGGNLGVQINVAAQER